MKILTVVSNLGKGGTQRAAQSFAEGYLYLGHDSRVLALYELGSRYDELKDQLPIWTSINLDNLKTIAVWKPEIVHIHSHGPKKSDIEKIVATCKGAKVIETNVFSKPSPWAHLVDVSFQLSHWAQWLYDIRGGLEFNSVILPNPIDCNAFKKASKREISMFKEEHEIPSNAFVIGRIGQALKGKWSNELLITFNKVSRIIPNTYLLIINPPYNILEKANESPFKNNIVHIPKIIGDHNLSTAYSSMDVMLLIAEQGESFGIVSTESILCETPVVTLNTPWGDNSQGEVIGNLKGGYVVNHKRNLSKIILDIYKGRIKYSPILGKKHIRKYDYVKVAEKAISYAISVEKRIPHKNKEKILSILKQSIDRPQILTKVFLVTSNNFLRLLTIYTTGYKGVNEMIKSTYNFFSRKYFK